MKDKLLPCPFCGGEAGMDADKIGKGKELYYVYCKNDCITQYGYSYSKENAIEKWNTRKPIERIVEQLEEELKKNMEFEWSYDIIFNRGFKKAIEFLKEIIIDGQTN